VGTGVLLRRLAVVAFCAAEWVSAGGVRAEDTQSGIESRESLSDAWWTGPMLANSAETMPPRHFLVEPYVYVVHAANSDSFGSSAYILYGLLDRLTIGITPVIGYKTASGMPSSSGIAIGDFALVTQYRLTMFNEGNWIPTTSIYIQQSLPTGKYDRLGNRPTNGFGSGVFSTQIALNTQEPFWLPNGRILRMRFNLWGSISTAADVEDVSVYGTAQGFRGTAKPGTSFFVNAAWEYSLTQRWVLALDVIYGYSANTRIAGYTTKGVNMKKNRQSTVINSGVRESFGFAPAIEYNFSSRVGILLGVRLIPFGQNTTPTVTPVVAINFVH
jgi:hypothetical protein